MELKEIEEHVSKDIKKFITSFTEKYGHCKAFPLPTPNALLKTEQLIALAQLKELKVTNVGFWVMGGTEINLTGSINDKNVVINIQNSLEFFATLHKEEWDGFDCIDGEFNENVFIEKIAEFLNN